MAGLKTKLWTFLVKAKDYDKPEHVKTVHGDGKKQSNENIKFIRNLFKLKKENETIKDRIIRDISSFFFLNKNMIIVNHWVNNFWNNNYI